MLFRNSLRLLFENFKNVYKILLYKLVISLVATALYCAMILPEFIEILESSAMVQLIADVKLLFSSFFSANGEQLSLTKDAIFGSNGSLYVLVDLVLSKMTAIVFVCIGCVLVYITKRVADTLCYFAVGSVINDKMSAYANTPYVTSYVANLGKATRYALLYVPVVFLWDVITIAMILALITTINLIPALFFSVTLVVLMQSLKLTFTWRWMPAMIADGKKLSKSVRAETPVERKQRWKIFSTYIEDVYLIIIINVIAGLATFGSALLITVPASYLLYVCQQFVTYYTVTGKKYFITYDKIAINPDYGDNENFFNYVDDTVIDTESFVASNLDNTPEEK